MLEAEVEVDKDVSGERVEARQDVEVEVPWEWA